MEDDGENVRRFRAVFGEKGGDAFLGNVGPSRAASAVCHEIMDWTEPLLYDYFIDWDRRDDEERRPFNVEQHLLFVGQWEGAWALAQLHYDQILKQEAKEGKPLHNRGHHLINIAIVARRIGSPSLVRHYASLSCVGDVFWEPNDPDLRYGALAPTMLEQFESDSVNRAWREKLRTDVQSMPAGKPLYPEPFLAARWFSDTYVKHFRDLNVVIGNGGKPFAEVLLDAVVSPRGAAFVKTGTRFEAADRPSNIIHPRFRGRFGPRNNRGASRPRCSLQS